MKFLHELMLFEGVEGDEIEAHFEFENIGRQNLEIEIVSACNCMELNWPRQQISPGERGVIKVIFDTKGLSGYVSKDIDVVFKNTDKEGYPLVIRGVLKGKLFQKI
ncbi:MAG: DUF1573 domain-containing protein [Lewinellaceae bacterium]|nr:DUF1573 domain-containing protein [Lewinellaceae bacterium]